MAHSLVKWLSLPALALSILSAPLVGTIVAPTSARLIAATPQQNATQAVLKAVARPNLPPPTVEKLTLRGEYGLATWLMGEAGGLVALVNAKGTWQVITLGGGVPDATALSQRGGMPVTVAQQLLNQHFPANTPPFASILPQLKRQTQVPILLPRSFLFQGNMFYRIGVASANRYNVDINYTPDCQGTPCYFGSIEAERGGQFTKPLGLPGETFKSITLHNKTPGIFMNACGAYCTASVEWKLQGVLYRVSIKNGREADVVAMANSAIASGSQSRVSPNRASKTVGK